MTESTHITEKLKCQPAGGARGKVALGIIQSGLKLWTDSINPTYTRLELLEMYLDDPNLRCCRNEKNLPQDVSRISFIVSVCYLKTLKCVE